MYSLILHVPFHVLGAAPFLPQGKGALILILGGMATLALALLWSFFGPRPHRGAMLRPTRSRPMIGVAHGGLVTRTVAARGANPTIMDSGAPWVRTVMSTAVHAELGKPALVHSESGRHTIQLSNCRTCRTRRRGNGCEHERGILERAVKTFAPRGRVVELTCNSDPRGTCTFVLLPGVRSA